MICEVCGKNVPRLRKVLIEGAVMNVCDDCAKLGTPIEKNDLKINKSVPHVIHHEQEKKVPRKKEDVLDEEMVLVDDYGERIKNARLSMNLSLEDAAKKLLEKKNVLSKIERNEMKPDKELIRKLEKFYNIKLMEKVTVLPGEQKTVKNSLTLGDLIKKD
ncbi:MAG: multiprotein bridging factor aMBF1 [Thermoplasmata archaeon]|nr:multiprotein bridging factor aMBF1 [Thermoplasmata archaeon]